MIYSLLSCTNVNKQSICLWFEKFWRSCDFTDWIAFFAIAGKYRHVYETIKDTIKKKTKQVYILRCIPYCPWCIKSMQNPWCHGDVHIIGAFWCQHFCNYLFTYHSRYDHVQTSALSTSCENSLRLDLVCRWSLSPNDFLWLEHGEGHQSLDPQWPIWRHFAHNIFKCIFSKNNYSFKFHPNVFLWA